MLDYPLGHRYSSLLSALLAAWPPRAASSALLLLALAGCSGTKPIDSADTADEDGDDDGAVSSLDCDDGDPAVHPGATEVCDGIDNDCDGETDLAALDASTWYADADLDGFGDTTRALTACEAPEGYVGDATDCDDTDDSVHPGADETCDEVDQDCDGDIDEDASDQGTWYADTDLDGYGDAASSLGACEAPDGYVADSTDCDDTDDSVHPGATEDCADPTDYNCDGSVEYADVDGDGFAACTECDDSSAEVRPDADESCNGVDDDCDGSTDEDPVDGSTWYADTDGDGYGDASATAYGCEAASGYVADASDCLDTDAAVHPDQAETCDGVDEDCDGDVDEEATDAATWYADTDGDGYGDAGMGSVGCEAPASTVADASDCDDLDDTINPAASEQCDGVDEDCDGDVDEEATDAATWYPDTDGDGYGDATVSASACELAAGYVVDATDCDDTTATAYPGATETCDDGVDEDCDGEADPDSLCGDDDDDELANGEELTLGTDPDDSDSDDDGVDDGEEVSTWGSDPLLTDSDGDGLEDGGEVETWYTDPTETDTDGDGVSDDAEIASGDDPNQSGSTVLDPDLDGDGRCDDTTYVVTFEATDGTLTNLSADFWGTSTSPSVVTLTDAGTLWICGGTRYAQLTLTGSVDVVGDGATTTLHGAGTGVVVTASGTELGLYALDLTEGVGTEGGCVSFSGSTLTIAEATISSCDARDGGGVYSSATTVEITDTTVSDNAAGASRSSSYTASGGGLYLASSTVTLERVTIGSNTAGLSWYSNGYGGGLYHAGGTLTVRDSDVSDNVLSSLYHGVSYGCGIYSGGDVEIIDSSVTGNSNPENSADYALGGGIFASGSLTLDGATVTDNTLVTRYHRGYGAAAWGTSISVTDSTVSDNDGGTLYGALITSSGTCTSSTFSGNVGCDYGDCTSGGGYLTACATGTVSF